MTGGDALGDDRRLRVAAEMNHLGAGVGLLMMMGEGDRIEFADRVIAAQDAARIFPGHRRAGLDLRPRDLARHTTTIAAFGDAVVDAADAVLFARIPILYGRLLDHELGKWAFMEEMVRACYFLEWAVVFKKK